MSYKKASIFVLIAMIFFGILGCYGSLTIEDSVVGSFAGKGSGSFWSGPKFYPFLLCILIVLFSVWELIATLKDEEEKAVTWPNVSKSLSIIVIISIWIFVWQHFHIFYPISVIASAAMLYILNPQPKSVKKVLKSLAVAAVTVLIVYLIFSVALKISL